MGGWIDDDLAFQCSNLTKGFLRDASGESLPIVLMVFRIGIIQAYNAMLNLVIWLYCDVVQLDKHATK